MNVEKRQKITNTVGAVIKAVLIAVLAVYSISLVLPLIWTILNSVKDEYSYIANPFGLPDIWMFSNYLEALDYLKVRVVTSKGIFDFGLFQLALNSVIRAVGISVINIFFQTICSYTLARYKFKGNSTVYMAGLVLMLLPIVGSMPSAMMIARTIGTYDNLFLNIVTAPSMIFSLNFLLLYAAHKGVPWTFAEAAFVEGAGHYRVMFMMQRMVLSTCAVLFVMSFLGIWNDYATPLVWLPSFPNLAYGLYLVQWEATSGGEGASTPVLLSTFIIVMIPTIIMYLSAQKLIEKSFVVGGLKG